MTAPIDLTDRYFKTAYMRDGTALWTVNRVETPVEGVIIHHTAGFYGPELNANADRDAEVRQLDSLARDHFERFGIGPGYHYAVFPSGRAYAVGKYGTHRAHVRGRRPGATPVYWNRVALGLVVFGNYERDELNDATAVGVRAGVSSALGDVTSYAPGDLWVGVHGRMRTVARDGTPTPQTTQCPGRNLRDRLVEWNIWHATTSGHVPLEKTGEKQNNAYERGYKDGFDKGFDEAAYTAFTIAREASDSINSMEAPEVP